MSHSVSQSENGLPLWFLLQVPFLTFINEGLWPGSISQINPPSSTFGQTVVHSSTMKPGEYHILFSFPFLPLLFSCLCVSVCVCCHMQCAIMIICMDTWGIQRLGCLPQCLLYLTFWRQDFSLNLDSFQLEWLNSRLPGSACLWHPVQGFEAHTSMVGFYIGSGDLNSCPHTCVAHNLHTEPSFLPLYHILKKIC